MRITHKMLISALLIALHSYALTAQKSEKVNVVDGVVERTLIREKAPLPYQQLREADVSWEKKIWRVIDVREKMNLAFVYPERPFFDILQTAISNGDVTVYSGETDNFSMVLSKEEAMAVGTIIDTMVVPDFDNLGRDKLKVIRHEVDYTQVKRFRIKEAWYFDEESSTMKVRILGIAPIMEMTDENGNFRYEQAMFWIYYPELRTALAKEQVPISDNTGHPMTWEDLLEMRHFSSYIYKAANIRNERIQDYITGNLDRLLEADKIEQSLFNFEQDLWSY